MTSLTASSQSQTTPWVPHTTMPIARSIRRYRMSEREQIDTLSVSLEWGDDSDTDSVSEEHDEINESVRLQRERNLPATHDPDTKSVSAECGSVAESVCSEIDDTTSDKNDGGVSENNLATATEPKETSRHQEHF
ncbi:unnamed protein product [Phytophthora fragariaefolia]|uniref:Unnamed protein product n=1 Tax=Phytophthora fragariaefolia TaxID=1490495 RepID=A0A9W6Y3Q4_9STRA|nr:unnamed protein product [Phytophthora fragariaefolia]